MNVFVVLLFSIIFIFEGIPKITALQHMIIYQLGAHTDIV